jgi:hypothetical protein
MYVEIENAKKSLSKFTTMPDLLKQIVFLADAYTSAPLTDLKSAVHPPFAPGVSCPDYETYKVIASNLMRHTAEELKETKTRFTAMLEESAPGQNFTFQHAINQVPPVLKLVSILEKLITSRT